MALSLEQQELLDALKRGTEPYADLRFGRSDYQPFGAENLSPIRTFKASTGRTIYYAPTDRPGTSLSVGPGGATRLAPDQFSRGTVLASYGAGLQRQGLTAWDEDPLRPGGFTVQPGAGSGLAKGVLQVLALGAPILAAPFLAAGVAGAASGAGGGGAVLKASGDVGLSIGNTAGAWDSVLSTAFPGAGIEASVAPVGLSPSLAASAWSAPLAQALPNIAAGAPPGKTLTFAETLGAAREVIATGIGTAQAVKSLTAGRPTAQQAAGYAPQLVAVGVPQQAELQRAGTAFPANAATLVVVGIVALVVVMAVKGK